MLMAVLFGAVASSALLVGAFIGVRFELPKRLLAILLSFASGALITALTFELFEDAYERGGIERAAIGLFAGAAVFTGLSALLDRWAQPGTGVLPQMSSRGVPNLIRTPRLPTVHPLLRPPVALPEWPSLPR
ncbi:hypothetical protein ACW0JT_07800 [Arthrobacter sp. SA17]